MQDVLSSIRKSVDQADTAVKAIQSDLVSQLNAHADGLSVNAASADRGVLSRTVPAWYLVAAGAAGIVAGVVGRIFV
jgi:hypothetical protein